MNALLSRQQGSARCARQAQTETLSAALLGFRLTGTVLLATLLMSGCDGLPFFGSRYAYEVGYYEAGKERWEIEGDFAGLDECRSSAMAVYNLHAAQRPGSVISWACLKKRSDGGYESRHR